MERGRRSFGQIFGDDARIREELASRISKMQNWLRTFPGQISEQTVVDRKQRAHFERHGDYLKQDSPLLHHK